MAAKYISLVLLVVFVAVLLDVSVADPPPPPSSTTTPAPPPPPPPPPTTTSTTPAPPTPPPKKWVHPTKPAPAARPAPPPKPLPPTKQAPPTKPAPPSYLPATLAPPTINPCVGKNNEAVLLPHKDCRKFYICNHGKLVEFNCGKGLHFNRKYKICDYPNSAGCASRPRGKVLKCYYA